MVNVGQYTKLGDEKRKELWNKVVPKLVQQYPLLGSKINPKKETITTMDFLELETVLYTQFNSQKHGISHFLMESYKSIYS